MDPPWPLLPRGCACTERGKAIGSVGLLVCLSVCLSVCHQKNIEMSTKHSFNCLQRTGIKRKSYLLHVRRFQDGPYCSIPSNSIVSELPLAMYGVPRGNCVCANVVRFCTYANSSLIPMRMHAAGYVFFEYSSYSAMLCM